MSYKPNDSQDYSVTTQPPIQGHDVSHHNDEEQGGEYDIRSVTETALNDVLIECRAVNQAIDKIEIDIERLGHLQSRYLADTNTSTQSPLWIELDQTRHGVIRRFQGLITVVKNIKSQPESENIRTASQVGNVNRRLRRTFYHYQQVERVFRQESENQIARQYRIIRPDASDSDIREAIENNVKIFSSALIQSGRRGEVNLVTEEVSRRHDRIRRIEGQIGVIVQLFQDLETFVVEQEHAVAQIEQREEEIVGNIAEGNAELAGAVEKARATRRKKWWCLGIGVTVIVIVVVVIVVVLLVIKPGNRVKAPEAS